MTALNANLKFTGFPEGNITNNNDLMKRAIKNFYILFSKTVGLDTYTPVYKGKNITLEGLREKTNSIMEKHAKVFNVNLHHRSFLKHLEEIKIIYSLEQDEQNIVGKSLKNTSPNIMELDIFYRQTGKVLTFVDKERVLSHFDESKEKNRI